MKNTSNAESEPSGAEPVRDATAVDAVSCRLDPDQVRQRREWIEETLLPHLTDIDHRENCVTLTFERSATAYDVLTEVIWKESQCCAWAHFELEISPGDGPITWYTRSDDPAKLEEFAAEIRAMRS